MERRTYRFFTKRSEHYNNLQKEEEKLNNSINNNNLQVASGGASPLKDHSNIQNNRVPTSTASETSRVESRLESTNTQPTEQNQKNSPSQPQQRQQPAVSSPNVLAKTYTTKNTVTSTQSSTTSHVQSNTTTTSSNERPLKCLETLAQKAGITFDEKYEVASTLLTLEKSQSPAQQVAAPTSVPLQISQEQLQQLYLQQAYGGAVQVKQEFPNQTISNMELKQQIADHNQQQVQQMQIVEAPPSPHQPPNSSAMSMPQQNQQNATINTMSPLQLSSGQMPADWGGRVQVVQQQIQNPQYLQGMYGAPQVLMNGNILTPGLGPQVQVIAAGKHFQGGQLTSQMLAQGKQMIGNGQGFSGTYTLPTIPSSQQQTLLFSPVSAVNVISSPQQQQQQNILPALTSNQGNANKQPTQQDLQKAALGQKVLQKITANGTLSNNQIQGNNQAGGQCVQVSQAMPTAQMISPIQQAGAQHMQFAPWNAIPQFQWTNGLSPQPMLAQNNRYIIATNQDGTAGLQFIQHNPQTNQTIQTQPQTQTLALSNLQQAVQQQQQQQQHQQQQQQQQQQAQQQQQQQQKRAETLAPKLQANRTPNILPQGAQGQLIRPASSVSTQTAQNQAMLNQKQSKMRTKQHPTVRPAVPNLKTDASNQTKTGNMAGQQQQSVHTVATSAGNKMVVFGGTTMISQQMQNSLNNVGNDKQQQQLQQQMKVQQQHMIQQQQQQQALLQQQQAIQQQIQLQQQLQLQHQIQIQPAQQQQFSIQSQQQHQQQVQNQLIQQQQAHGTILQQQIVVQPQQQQTQVNQMTITTSSPNVQQHVNIQPKPPLLISQQSTSQAQQIDNHRPVMSMVSISGNTTMSSGPTLMAQSQPINSMCHLTTPLTSPPQVPLIPPPNPLVAMSTLSAGPYNSNSVTVTPSLVHSNKEKTNEVAPNTVSSEKNADSENVLSTPVTTTTTSNGDSKENEVTPMDTTPAEGDDASQTDLKSNTDTTAITTTTSTPSTTAVKLESISSLTTSTSNSTLTTSTTTSVADANDSCIGGTGSSGSIVTNGTTCNAASSPSSNLLNNNNKNEKGLPKAMVKPNVLTHVIGDFVIQEANEPFPLTRQRYPDDAADEPPKKRQTIEAVEKPSSCENCRKLEKSSKKKKQYCSQACAKAANKSTDDQSTLQSPDQTTPNEPTSNGNSQKQQANVSRTQTNDTTNASDSSTNEKSASEVVAKWTVAEVCEFIRNLQECSTHAEDFENQEIDGQALLLLKEDNLVNVMQMKLGPAVKLVARVREMVEKNQEQ
ncbi:polyhomeotic-proximal chromatin protein-like isoform X4 [Bradysia coprophila]|uniref:polyhomeotic-proximal chromatin protein-like isoform X4 n=1 Tax=Bradysia coprophila TaxID=38358 RepID=UPI00187D8F9F|nr:polyhomeotic-proximal chromatin protein-like isoform X4 [Bradysia coprophila]